MVRFSSLRKRFIYNLWHQIVSLLHQQSWWNTGALTVMTKKAILSSKWLIYLEILVVFVVYYIVVIEIGAALH